MGDADGIHSQPRLWRGCECMVCVLAGCGMFDGVLGCMHVWRRCVKDRFGRGERDRELLNGA